MVFTVTAKDKTEREALVKEFTAWKDSEKLSYPKIYSITTKGKKIEIDFHASDSNKIVRMVRRIGHDID